MTEPVHILRSKTKRLTLSRDTLLEFLTYNPDTGVFIANKTSTNRKFGEVAGFTRQGYINIGVGGKKYRAHRLAFLFMTGEIPEYIDHINGIGTDNRFSNLRACTHAENCRNRPANKGNKYGFKGVTYIPKDKSYRANIMVDGRTIYLGKFNTAKEAGRAYLDAAKIYHKDFSSRATKQSSHEAR